MIDGGKVSGKTLTGVLKADVQGTPMEFAIEGTIDGDKITGTLTGGAVRLASVCRNASEVDQTPFIRNRPAKQAGLFMCPVRFAFVFQTVDMSTLRV